MLDPLPQASQDCCSRWPLQWASLARCRAGSSMSDTWCVLCGWKGFVLLIQGHCHSWAFPACPFKSLWCCLPCRAGLCETLPLGAVAAFLALQIVWSKQMHLSKQSQISSPLGKLQLHLQHQELGCSAQSDSPCPAFTAGRDVSSLFSKSKISLLKFVINLIIL